MTANVEAVVTATVGAVVTACVRAIVTASLEAVVGRCILSGDDRVLQSGISGRSFQAGAPLFTAPLVYRGR